MMGSEKNNKSKHYSIIGIGPPGKYVIEYLSSSPGANVQLSLHHYKKFNEFLSEDIIYNEETKALFLVLQPGDSAGDNFIHEIESFGRKTGIPVYTIANYPFLWEGRSRISNADDILKDLVRVSLITFSIVSHQWFPLKEQLGFHKVVKLVHDIALRVLLSIIELDMKDINIQEEENISIDEDVEATKQHEDLWLVIRDVQ